MNTQHAAYRIILSLAAFLFAASALASDTEGDASRVASRIVSLIDTIMDRHLAPPTKQQMVLSGIQSLYNARALPAPAADHTLARRWITPKGLSSRISELRDRNEFEVFLTDILNQCEQIDVAESMFCNAVVETLPGGGRFVDGKNSRVNEQIRANRYVGIGIALAMDKDTDLPQISRVIYDGPAWKADIEKDDLIVGIDGQSSIGKELGTIIDELRGADGSSLTIVLRRPDFEELRTVKLTRRRVFIPSVRGPRQEASGKWVYSLEKAEDIAYVRFSAIGPSTLHELRTLASDLRQQPYRGLIVDLRSGGGVLHDTIVVADSFLDGGTIGHVLTLDATKTHQARPGSLFGDLPVVVLIGPHTSHGSSFLAAALQDAGKAKLVGQMPHAAAWVNSVIELPHREDTIILSTGLLLRAEGMPLMNGMLTSVAIPVGQVDLTVHQEGDSLPRCKVLPDVEVKEKTGKKRDLTLDKAIELLRGDSL